ncbi:MAG: PTS sugar transporter subunit IIA [Treponema sp.]|nr:PTS sugar transporter subunit IIA [Treponema sp.]
MLLQDVLLPESIKVDLEAEDKHEAFKELITHYCNIDKSSFGDKILDAIVTREAKMSTGIRKGIAIPHGKTDAVNTIRGILGISQKGIQYDSLDGEPVYLLFMLISPIDDSGKHLLLLKHLAELFEIPEFQAELQSQKDPQSAFEVICKYEKMLSAADLDSDALNTQ